MLHVDAQLGCRIGGAVREPLRPLRVRHSSGALLSALLGDRRAGQADGELVLACVAALGVERVQLERVTK
jgi:hypothetical protein